MSQLIEFYPIMVVQSRYSGVYEGGNWHAVPNAEAGWMWSEGYFDYMFGDDGDAVEFWGSEEAEKIGRGGTPNAAVLDLIERHHGVRQWDYDEYADTLNTGGGELGGTIPDRASDASTGGTQEGSTTEVRSDAP
jgi:hypothetical protein